MTCDYSKLRGKIVEVCGTYDKFSDKMGITPLSVGRKMSNKSEWKQSEIVRACSVLALDRSAIPEYFFATVV